MNRASAPSWDRLYEVAESQAGYLTTAQASEAGYSRPLIHHHVRRGRLDRVSRGIYRLRHFPPSEHEELVVAWLWSGQEGVFSHETALGLHELSDALPHQVHMLLPIAWSERRVRVPDGFRLEYDDVPAADRCWVGPVPVTNAARTIRDCVRDHVDPGLVAQAVAEGVERGLFSREQVGTSLPRGANR